MKYTNEDLLIMRDLYIRLFNETGTPVGGQAELWFQVFLRFLQAKELTIMKLDKSHGDASKKTDQIK